MSFLSNLALIASLHPLDNRHPATEISKRLVSQPSILLARCGLHLGLVLIKPSHWLWKHPRLSLRSNQTMNSSNLHTEINAPATAQGPQVISSVFGDNANIRE